MSDVKIDFEDMRLTSEFLRDCHPSAFDAYVGGEVRRVLAQGKALLIRELPPENERTASQPGTAETL